MKINNLKINSYGKLRNKELNFKNGINVIYGKNEAGKSTILNFIFNASNPPMPTEAYFPLNCYIALFKPLF